MSYPATTAAWAADVSPPARKLVLVYLAHCHNEETGQLNPSVATVARACGLSEKQARRHIRDLEESGILEVTGNHYGGNVGATKRYKLNLELASTTPADVTPPVDVTPPTDGSAPLPPMGVHPSHTGASPLPPMGAKQERTGIEQERNRNKRAIITRPDSVSESVWGDFLVIRKAKRAPMTATALAGIEREAAKAGITLNAALAYCCERDWKSFKAEWYSNATATDGKQGSGRKLPQRENFDNIDYGPMRKIGDPWPPRKLPRRENFDDINYGETGLL